MSDPDDRSLDYVYNTPALDATILRGHLPHNSISHPDIQQSLKKISELFSNRKLYIYDVKAKSLSEVYQEILQP